MTLLVLLFAGSIRTVGNTGRSHPQTFHRSGASDFAGIALGERRYERATQLIGAAEEMSDYRERPGLFERFDQAELERLTEILRKELGDENFKTLIVQGRAMTREQAVAFALEKNKR